MADSTGLSKIDMGPMSNMMHGSPKNMYTFFLLSLAKNYFETVVTKDKASVEGATAALIAFCPNREKRKQLWQVYTETRDKYDGDIISASTLCVGELISFLSEMLEFEEVSTGGML
jgi:hypothetical protein